ncbi:uncharacterized protein G2W53_017531 [Senna tora]|uniref:Uncharacterized protein n=1 Tax=Senna tora TaxID=362788 RepID=A0A834TR15_9FABA|nr:uncharacterized protein G2W53_017531 [Senna tora]
MIIGKNWDTSHEWGEFKWRRTTWLLQWLSTVVRVWRLGGYGGLGEEGLEKKKMEVSSDREKLGLGV